MAQFNEFSNEKILFIINAVYLAIHLLNLIPTYHYLKLSLCIYKTFINANHLTINLIFLFLLKLTMIEILEKISNT